MKELSKESTNTALSWFMEMLAPLLEGLGPVIGPRRKMKNKNKKEKENLSGED